MKYIRTKDGIVEYKDSDKIIITATPEQIEYWQKHFKSVVEKNDWKLADTIEELCDEFVIVDEENEHYINQLNDIHHIRRKWAIGNYTIYGAIWTDKGLIYVAKMNEKGELELL